MKKLVFIFICSILFSGCTATQHRKAVQDDTHDRITVGKVQGEITIGMSGAEVAQVLGSPNIVTTDEERREVWIYDKISTEVSYSKSSTGVGALLIGVGVLVGGAGGLSGSADSGASSKSQKTLTIIIKYDEDKKVRDFAYHSSSF